MIAAYIILGAFGLFFALLTWEKRPQSSRPPADAPKGPLRK